MRAIILIALALALGACGPSTMDLRQPTGATIMDDLVAETSPAGSSAAVIGSNGGELAGYVVARNLTLDGKPADPEASALFTKGNLTADPAEALALYEAAGAIVEDHPAILNNRGLQLFRLGRREDARESFRRAIIADPGFQPAEDNLDRILRRLPSTD